MEKSNSIDAAVSFCVEGHQDRNLIDHYSVFSTEIVCSFPLTVTKVNSGQYFSGTSYWN